MSEKGILFSAPMVRAILAGKKTQTRRLVKLTAPPYTNAYRHPDGGWVFSSAPVGEVGLRRICAGRQGIPCPKGAPGDRLWVKETWRAEERDSDCVDGVHFAADDTFRAIENTRDAADAWGRGLRQRR